MLRSERGPRVRAARSGGHGQVPRPGPGRQAPAPGFRAGVPPLMDYLEDEIEDLEVRRRCLESVAPFNSEEVEDYIRWAYEDEDQDLRSSSIYAMGRTGATHLAPHADAGAGQLRPRRPVRDRQRLRRARRGGPCPPVGGTAQRRRPRGQARQHFGPRQDRRSLGPAAPSSTASATATRPCPTPPTPSWKTWPSWTTRCACCPATPPVVKLFVMMGFRQRHLPCDRGAHEGRPYT